MADNEKKDSSLILRSLPAAILALALTIGMVAGGFLAFCGIGGGILFYGAACLAQKRLILPDQTALGFGLGFLILVLLADATAIAPERSWHETLNLISIVIPLTLLFVPQDIVWPRWFRYLPWAVLATEILLIAELASGGKILMPLLHAKNDRLVFYNRGLSYAAVLLWPFFGMLLRDRRAAWAGILLVGLTAAILFSPSRGAVLALLTGAMIALTAWHKPRLAALGCAALLAIVALLPLAAPLLFETHAGWLDHVPTSWRHRVEIWDYLLAFDIAHQPWLGHGPDAAGIIPPLSPHQNLYVYATAPAAHPHHAALQLWLELGPGGWLLGVGLAVFCLRRLIRLEGISRATGMAAWAAFLTLSCGSFSLWSDSFLSLLALTAWWVRQPRKEGIAEPPTA